MKSTNRLLIIITLLIVVIIVLIVFLAKAKSPTPATIPNPTPDIVEPIVPPVEFEPAIEPEVPIGPTIIREYTSRDVGECSIILMNCSAGHGGFNDDTGCGCFVEE